MPNPKVFTLNGGYTLFGDVTETTKIEKVSLTIFIQIFKKLHRFLKISELKFTFWLNTK